MSPYRFGSTSTSYSSGFCTNCIHMLSTMRSSILDVRILFGHLRATSEEQAVRELHDVGLVNGRHFLASVLARVVEGELDDPLAAGDADRLDRDAGLVAAVLIFAPSSLLMNSTSLAVSPCPPRTRRRRIGLRCSRGRSPGRSACRRRRSARPDIACRGGCRQTGRGLAANGR